MNAAERKLIAIEVAKEISKTNDEVLNFEDIKRMFSISSNSGVYKKIKSGLPARRKKGIGYYFLKSEVINFLKN